MDQQNTEIPHSISETGNELIQYIVQQHEHLMLDKAYDLVQIYYQKNQQNPKEFPIQKGLFMEIQAFHKETLFLQQQLQDQKDWLDEGSNQHFKMSYKYIANTPHVALKWESTMRVPVVNACALIYQTELFNQWVPFCKVSRNIKQVRMGHKVCYVLCELPVLNNRELYVRGYGVDKLDNGNKFMICCQSIHHDTEYKDKYQIDTTEKENVQIDVKFFTMEITLVNPNEFIMKCVAHIDPKMKFIPAMVMNFFIRKFAKFLYEKFIKLAYEIKGTPWETAMAAEENKGFYEYIQRRFEKYFKQD